MSQATTHCPRCAGTGADSAHLWDDGTPAACEECDGYAVAAIAKASPYVRIRAKENAGMFAKARAWWRARFNRDAHAIRTDTTRTVGQRMHLGLAVRPKHLNQRGL